MAAIPLGLASYDRADLPRILLQNCFYEASPANLEDQVAILPRPRMLQFATAGAGPITGLYRKGGVMATALNSGKILARSADQLFKVDQNTGAATLLGTVTGTQRMSAEGNPDVVVLTCGGTLYQTDGSSLSTVDMPAGFNAYAVDVLNDYFLIASDNGQFFWSAIGGTTIDPLDYATAESQPDVLRTLKVIGDELWLLGRLSIEVWQPTGDLNLPFQRIGGRIFGIGITAIDTCQKLNVNGIDTICWVGTDRRVYQTNPNPTRISPPWLDEKLGKATITQADSALNPYAAAYSWNGHDFYILHIPGQGSYAYDLMTQQWDEVTSYNHPLFRGAVNAFGVNSQPLLGDDTTAVIWQMVDTQITDGSDPVVFEFTGLLEVPGAPTRCNSVSLDLSAGTTTDPADDPMIQMAISTDLGRTFQDVDPQPLGREGEFETGVRWTGLGLLRRPGRLHRWRTTLPVTVRKARYNESLRS